MHPKRLVDPGGGTRRVRLVRGEGRGVSDEYGVRDAACPISTKGAEPVQLLADGAADGRGAAHELQRALLRVLPRHNLVQEHLGRLRVLGAELPLRHDSG